MQVEIFDVVNDQDEVVDCRPRREIHQLGLKHRAVHVLVFNSQGKLFLQKRSLEKDCFPGAWDSSASGHLDSGEEYDACALRELKEELGITPAPPPVRLFKIQACPQTGHEFVWVYRCHSDGPFNLHPEEIEQGAWFTPAEINQWLHSRPAEFAGGFQEIWRKLAHELLAK